jgi:hypothetical protein
LDKVESKFLINGKKYAVKIKGEEEVQTLMEYLDFDFIQNEIRKVPMRNKHFYNYNDFMVVSCFHKHSIVVDTEDDVLAIFGDSFFDDKLKKAIPLKAFMEPEKYPEYLI